MAKPKPGCHDLFAQVPEELWQALAEEAEREDRSITGQLVNILRARYTGTDRDEPAKPSRKRRESGKG